MKTFGTTFETPASPVLEQLECRSMMSVNLPYGGVVSATLAAKNQINSYQFSATKGATVEINTAASAIDSGFDAEFLLKSSAGATVDRWFGGSSRHELNLTGGTYTLLTADYSGNYRGQIAIGLEGISPFSPSPIGLPYGGVDSGSITDQLDVKQYTFAASAGSNVQIDTAASAIDSGFDAQFRLYDSTGALRDAWYGGTLRTETNMPAGNYMIEVNDYSHVYRGRYEIGLERLNQTFSPDAVKLVNNVTVNSSIAGTLDVKEFTFKPAKSTVSLTVTAAAIDSGFDATFVVYDTSGARLGYWYGTHNVTITGLTVGATYMIKVEDYSLTNRGNFSIKATGL